MTKIDFSDVAELNRLWRQSYIDALQRKRHELLTQASKLALCDQVAKLQAMNIDSAGLRELREVEFAVEHDRLKDVLEGSERKISGCLSTADGKKELGGRALNRSNGGPSAASTGTPVDQSKSPEGSGHKSRSLFDPSKEDTIRNVEEGASFCLSTSTGQQ